MNDLIDRELTDAELECVVGGLGKARRSKKSATSGDQDTGFASSSGSAPAKSSPGGTCSGGSCSA